MCLGICGNKTKKILFSLLSGVVLFVLLSLSSKAYCEQVSSISEFESTISQIMSAMSTNNDNYKALNQLFNSNGWASNKSILPFSDYSNLIVRCRKDSSVTWYIDFLFYNSDVTFNVTNAYVTSTNTFTTQRYRFNIAYLGWGNSAYEGNSSESLNEFRRQISINYNFGIFFCNSTFYNTQNYDVWGYNYPILNYFSFNYVSDLTDIQIEDFNTMKQIPKDYNTLNYVAEFGKYINLDTTTYKPTYTIWKYEKPQNYFEPLIVYDYNKYSYINDDLGTIYLSESMLIPNTIIEINLKPIDLDSFSPLSILFYITDENTIISNGTIDENSTFNNDYYNRYTNIITNLLNENKGNITTPSGDITGSVDFTPIINGVNDINNTLTDDSDTDNIISSNLSGDYESFGEDIGYQVWENPFFTFLYNIFEDFYNALTQRGNIQISLNSHSINNWILNTDDFVTPSSSLKNVTRACLIFFYIYFNYKFFYHLITLVQTFRIKTTIAVLGTDEFYDTDYM